MPMIATAEEPSLLGTVRRFSDITAIVCLSHLTPVDFAALGARDFPDEPQVARHLPRAELLLTKTQQRVARETLARHDGHRFLAA